jgi:hypothetical protein
VCGNTIATTIGVFEERDRASQQDRLNRRRFAQSQELTRRSANRNQNQNRVAQAQADRQLAEQLDRLDREAELFSATQRVQTAASGTAGVSIQEINRQFLLEESEAERALLQQGEDADQQFDFNADSIALGAETSVFNALPDPVNFPTFLGSYLKIAGSIASDAATAVGQANAK